MNTSDGGPAFPALNYIVPQDLEERHVHILGKTQGMSMRDYFAAKAMQSLLSDSRYGGIVGINCYEQYRAIEAYKIADAMLAERAKSTG